MADATIPEEDEISETVIEDEDDTPTKKTSSVRRSILARRLSSYR